MSISKELIEIRALMLGAHITSIGVFGFKETEWLRALPYFEKCNCQLCQAMCKITVLEVNLAVANSDDLKEIEGILGDKMNTEIKTEQEKQIPKGLDVLQKRIEQLEKLVIVLQEKLEPILNDDSIVRCVDEETKNEKPLVSLAKIIYEYSNRIDIISDKVAHLNKDIEI